MNRAQRLRQRIIVRESMVDMPKENFLIEAALSLEMAEMDRTGLQTIK